MPHAEQQQQPPYVPGQFYTTKYTLLILIVLHLISVLFYATLALNFISRPELSRAYTEKEADAAKPKVLAASAIGAITSCTGFLALSTWHLAFTGIFAFLCAVSALGYHFCALTDPVVEPLSSMHLFPVALAVILFVLTAFYISLQLQMGILTGKQEKKRKKKKGNLPPLGVDTELQLYNFIAESRSAYYVRQTLVAATVLHIAWTAGYLVERMLYLHRIAATNETIETDAEIDLEVTMQNTVLSDACYSQSALATVIVLTGDLIGLVGVFRQKSIQLVAFAGTLVFGALYRFIAEDSELFFWLNMFFSFCLLTVNTTFAGLLLVYSLASAITQESSLAATISATSTQAAMEAAAAAAATMTLSTAAVANRNDEGGGGEKDGQKGKKRKKKNTKEKKAKKEVMVEVVPVKEKEVVKSTPSSGEGSSSSSSAGPSGTAAAAADATPSVAATTTVSPSGKEATD